jgi:hypothetical protein
MSRKFSKLLQPLGNLPLVVRTGGFCSALSRSARQCVAVPVFATRLSDREAYRAVFSFGGTLSSLPAKAVTNLAAARQNARVLTAELIERLRAEQPTNDNQKKLTRRPARPWS